MARRRRWTDQVLAAVMTDKATVEISSPVIGKVIWVGAKAGDTVAVGSPIVKLEVDGAGNAKDEDAVPAKAEAKAEKKAAAPKAEPNPAGQPRVEAPKPAAKTPAAALSGAPRKEGEKPLASPAVRKRAADAGVDLRRVPGTGPAGRITHEDLDRYFEVDSAPVAARSRTADTSVKEIPVIGLRRKIAEKMVDPVSGKADRDPLFVDFQKLLDPNLPAGSFRISWIAAGRRGHLDPKRIAEKAAGVIERIEAERGISKRKTEVDLQTGWLKWNWSDGVCLKLAWYQPSGGEATRFQPVWAS